MTKKKKNKPGNFQAIGRGTVCLEEQRLEWQQISHQKQCKQEDSGAKVLED